MIDGYCYVVVIERDVLDGPIGVSAERAVLEGLTEVFGRDVVT